MYWTELNMHLQSMLITMACKDIFLSLSLENLKARNFEFGQSPMRRRLYHTLHLPYGMLYSAWLAFLEQVLNLRGTDAQFAWGRCSILCVILRWVKMDVGASYHKRSSEFLVVRNPSRFWDHTGCFGVLICIVASKVDEQKLMEGINGCSSEEGKES